MGNTVKPNTTADVQAVPQEVAADTAEKILADARAQADEILAEARAQAEAEVAAAKTPTLDVADVSAGDPGEELVSVRLFRDNDKYKDDVFVAVNGERVQIKRGETVQIKKKFADVLEQSMRQDVATASMIERESTEYEAKAATLGL